MTVKVWLATVLFYVIAAGFQDLAYAQSKGGRWQFNNEGSDTATWDNIADAGELINQARFSADMPIQEETQYLLLDTTGVHDFFLIPDSDDLDFGDENIGLSAWIYPFVINDVHYLVNKGNQFTSPKTTNYALRISRQGQLEFLIRDANDRAQRVTSGFTIPENKWTFVGVFYDYSAGKVYMWNDPAAAAQDTLNFTQSLLPNDQPLAIGSWFRSDSVSPSIMDFEGRIDDVRISGRLADVIPEITTAIASAEPALPLTLILFQNYPNPFNPTTRISFTLAARSVVSLSVYNAMSQRVATLVNETLPAGHHETILDASGWSSGLYFYRLQAGEISTVQKMLLIQ
jgi:hypothetical protein